jgi:putative hydrolase of the HAD superfamily
MIDAVVFDWGGTLSLWADVDIEDMWHLAARHITAGEAEAAELVRRLVAVEDQMWTGHGDGSKSFRLVDLFRAASDELGVDVAEAVLEEAALQHLDAWTPHVRHDPEAASVLAELRRLGCRIGLVSNTHWPQHWHEHFLARDGLRDLIDVRVYSSDEPTMKPHPSIFAKALAALGAEAETALYVGDRQWDDVHGAQSAGIRAVWKHTRFAVAAGEAPDFTITRLAELPPLVRALGRCAFQG